VADRSSRIYEVRVAKPLVEKHDASEEEAAAIARMLMTLVDTSEKSGRPLQTSQLLVLTRAETEYLEELGVQLLQEVREGKLDLSEKDAAKKSELLSDGELRKRIKGLPASVDTALFGRMVTSDNFARVEAAVSVAHALTTHEEASETDYFTAVDTLKTAEDDAGAGLIQDTELTSGVFYLYAVLDMNQLRENLIGFDEAAAETLAHNLVRVMATHSPGAKRGSTAPYSFAEFALLERGAGQPRTLANAFRRPVTGRGEDLLQTSVTRLVAHRSALEEMYGQSEANLALSTIHELGEGAPPKATFDQALATIFPGTA
jgi:CRISPR system Cascade subunit CasC